MIEIVSHEPSQGGKAEAMTENAPSSAALGLHLLVVLGVSAIVAALIGGSGAAVSTALGVGLSALNLALMRRIVGALTAQSGLGALWALAFPVKLVVLVGGAFMLVQRGIAGPVPLAIGFALLPLSSVLLPRAGGSGRPSRTPLAPPHSTSPLGAGAPTRAVLHASADE
jgi:hypothetical protein